MVCAVPVVRTLVLGAALEPAFFPAAPGDVVPALTLDFTYVLAVGDTLTGTPTVVVDTSCLPSSAIVPTISSVALAAGLAGSARAVSWTITVPAKAVPAVYALKVSAVSTAGSALTRSVLLPVGRL